MNAIAKLDALSRKKGVSRDKMMDMLVEVWEEHNDVVDELSLSNGRLWRENAALMAELVEAKAVIATQRRELHCFKKDGIVARLRGLLRG